MKNNPLLKKANTQHGYTMDEIRELARCAEDPIYFIIKYCQIQHPIQGAIPFELRDYQKRVINTVHDNRLSIILSPRQSGKSWMIGAYLLWYAIFKPEKTVLIASNKNDNAMEMISRTRFIYERLPHWIKPGLTADGWNKHSIQFDNGSRIISQATSENTGRGLSISLLFLDEFAFVRDSVAEEFWTSISPTIATGGQCIICSTPNGDSNRFAQLWRGANIPSPNNAKIGINQFASTRVLWNEPPGRGREFKEAEIAKITEQKWRQEYECEFISSDPLLINSIVLNNLTALVNEVVPLGSSGDIIFYETPTSHKIYLVGMDVATGSGEDYTAIVAYEFPSMNQIMEFRSNTMSSPVGYHTLKKILRIFERTQSEIYFSVENNGVGEGIIALLENDENPPEISVFVSEPGQNRKGMTTTGKSKLKSCLGLKDMVERNCIHIKSKAAVAELKNFVRLGGSYSAKRGSTDDLVMATLIVIRLLEEIATYDQSAYDKLYAYSGDVTPSGDRQSTDTHDDVMEMVFG